jgi:pantoate--beta-alanine ligase
VIVTGDPDKLRALLDDARRRGKTVGLHAATGWLHGGHEANIAKMAAECDVATVAVLRSSGQSREEPSQTLPGTGDLEADLEKAEEAGAGIVFAPPKETVRAGGPLAHTEALDLAGPLAPHDRPGHREGTPAWPSVLGPLLALAGPCYAYFGEKDYSRLVAIERLVGQLSLPAVVVACPTVREPDGLALSRRNAWLRPEERRAAPALYWALLAGKRAVDGEGERDGDAVRAKMRDALESHALLELGCAYVADPQTLAPVSAISGEVRLLVAGRLGQARLVDNLAAGAAEE